MDPILKVSGLGIDFGGLQALDDFNIQVEGKEIVA
jgi:ABC-type branched-subunit amino acid transport system ATPase component